MEYIGGIWRISKVGRHNSKWTGNGISLLPRFTNTLHHSVNLPYSLMPNMLCLSFFVWKLESTAFSKKKKKSYGTDEPICRAGIETQTWRTNRWTWEQADRWDELGDWDWRMCTAMYKTDWGNAEGSCGVVQRAQLGALWWPRRVGWRVGWEGGPRGKRDMYTCGWFTL